MDRKRVLVVEDDERVRRVEGLILASAQLEIEEAKGGQEALDRLKAETFDLVVLDLMMPEVDGMQVLKTLRAHPRTENLPVIIVTAKNSDREVLEGFQSGANYYITKPFEPRELVDSVELILGVKLEA